MADIKRVGFIGIGKMGYPMAGHLAGAGFELMVSDLAEDVVDRFVAEHGGQPAPSLKELGQWADAVITMLPTSKIVRAVVLGDGAGDCVADGLEAGKIVMDMSTSDPVDTRLLGAELAKRGVGMVDSPVAGGVVFAKDATLSMTTGGDKDLLDHCRPLLGAMGRDNFYCGALGSGHAMKALNNYVNGCVLITCFEALTIGKRFGLETETMMESMIAATAGRNYPLEKKVKRYLDEPGFATGMALALLAKDVRIAVDTANAIGAHAPLAERCSELWAEARDRFGGDLDQIDVVRLWLEESDVSLLGGD